MKHEKQSYFPFISRYKKRTPPHPNIHLCVFFYFFFVQSRWKKQLGEHWIFCHKSIFFFCLWKRTTEKLVSECSSNWATESPGTKARGQPRPQRIERKIWRSRVWKRCHRPSNAENLIFSGRFMLNCGIIYSWCCMVSSFYMNNIHMVIKFWSELLITCVFR